MTLEAEDSDSNADGSTDSQRRKMLRLLLAGCGLGGLQAMPARAQQSDEGLHNALLWAVAWKQTSAEYRALCYQAFTLARMRLDQVMSDRNRQSRPLAVITDMDDTMMHAASYWGHLVEQNKDFFDDAIWDEWLPKNLITAAPGSRAFFSYCKELGVNVFYVTNRNQGDRTFEYALQQLNFLDMPFADEEHLYVFRDSSDKTPARDEIAGKFDIALFLGDNLNDYKRDYYVKDVDERLALMERDKADWGNQFILLPNPTDGHWVRAIFGESEPLPTQANRSVLKSAATRLAWDGT